MDENKIRFEKITTSPTANDLGSLFKEARTLAGFTLYNAGDLAASFDRRYSFGFPNYQKWEAGSKPGPNYKKALLGLFKGICDETVYPEWESAYNYLETELINKRADEKRRLKADSLKTEISEGQTNNLEENEAPIDAVFSSERFYFGIIKILGGSERISKNFLSLVV